MTRKRSSIFSEPKDKYVNRMKKRELRQFMHDDPLATANKENSIGKA